MKRGFKSPLWKTALELLHDRLGKPLLMPLPGTVLTRGIDSCCSLHFNTVHMAQLSQILKLRVANVTSKLLRFLRERFSST